MLSDINIVSAQFTFTGASRDGIYFDELYYGSTTTSAPVPEPATIALLGIGLAGLAGGAARRKWKKKAVDKT